MNFLAREERECQIQLVGSGALLGLALAIGLILWKLNPVYSLLLGTIFGAIIGDSSLSQTVNIVVAGTQSVMETVVRVLAAGVLAGVMMESGAANAIARAIFENANYIDFFITATEKQKDLLRKHFSKYTSMSPRIFDIPVGSIDKLIRPSNLRKQFSVMTASRIAAEKHIDWTIKSVVGAHKILPQITFDIYGKGGQE